MGLTDGDCKLAVSLKVCVWTSASDKAVVGVESSCGRDDREESRSEPACERGGRGGRGGGVNSRDCVMKFPLSDELVLFSDSSLPISPLGLPLLLTVPVAGGKDGSLGEWPSPEFASVPSGIASAGHTDFQLRWCPPVVVLCGSNQLQ